MKNSYEVTILNQKFVLRTELDGEHVRRVADYVNKVFGDIQQRAQNVSTQNIAILGALNIAEQMMLSEEQARDAVTRWKSRLEGLLPQDAVPDC
jgi:cell division protein ZapA (FtsZ GTPase activity inhibitor)